MPGGARQLRAGGERALLHATHCRLLARPREAYADAVADALCERWGAPMSTLLGREDCLRKVGFDFAAGFGAFAHTMRSARS